MSTRPGVADGRPVAARRLLVARRSPGSTTRLDRPPSGCGRGQGAPSRSASDRSRRMPSTGTGAVPPAVAPPPGGDRPMFRGDQRPTRVQPGPTRRTPRRRRHNRPRPATPGDEVRTGSPARTPRPRCVRRHAPPGRPPARLPWGRPQRPRRLPGSRECAPWFTWPVSEKSGPYLKASSRPDRPDRQPAPAARRSGRGGVRSNSADPAGVVTTTVAGSTVRPAPPPSTTFRPLVPAPRAGRPPIVTVAPWRSAPVMTTFSPPLVLADDGWTREMVGPRYGEPVGG